MESKDWVFVSNPLVLSGPPSANRLDFEQKKAAAVWAAAWREVDCVVMGRLSACSYLEHPVTRRDAGFRT
jgi:hypothetical protein